MNKSATWQCFRAVIVLACLVTIIVLKILTIIEHRRTAEISRKAAYTLGQVADALDDASGHRRDPGAGHE